MTDDTITEKRPLLEHLIELRRRFMIMVVSFFLCVGVCYAFAPEIYSFLVKPLAQSFPDTNHRRLIYTGLAEAFFTYLKIAMFGGFILAFPVIAGQLYLFIAPGLYKRERRLVGPYLVAAPVLFALGAALCYYYIFPMAWRFFIGFESANGAGGLPIQLEAKVSEYLSLVTHLILAFGLSFQLPVILALLTQSGMLKVATLKKGRRYAIVGISAIAAIITPPDVFSMVALAVPMVVLYELSILICSRL
jgi:sec-independent protein translocase protein TatC